MRVPVRRAAASLLACAGLVLAHAGARPTQEQRIPSGPVTTLADRTVQLPAQLPGRATVLIVGFGRHSQDATTAWEKPVRQQLANPPAVGFYDMAMLSEVPGFVRGLVLRRIRKEVPDVLKPNFVPLFSDEDAWKLVAGYSADQPEAAYVLLVDGHGVVRWSTHAAYTPGGFHQLTQAAQQLAGGVQ